MRQCKSYLQFLAKYTVWRPLGRDGLLYFLLGVPVTNIGLHSSCCISYCAEATVLLLLYQPNGQWNMSKMVYKI